MRFKGTQLPLESWIRPNAQSSTPHETQTLLIPPPILPHNVPYYKSTASTLAHLTVDEHVSTTTDSIIDKCEGWVEVGCNVHSGVIIDSDDMVSEIVRKW